MTPSVKVLATGGTIVSTIGEGGAAPEKEGGEIVEAIPKLTEYADISVEQVSQTPSSNMDWETMHKVGQGVRDAAADGFDGVVVVHGTDTMEESAYYIDLTLGVSLPVVFTGAQRMPDELSPDGPSNLLTAVQAITHPTFRETNGTFVAFDEKIHAARDVTKRHTNELDAFASPDKGPVAAVSRADLRIFRRPESNTPTLPHIVPDSTVQMIKTGIAVSGNQITRAVDSGVDGIVLEGTGLGNATAPLGERAASAIKHGIPIVVTSRCYAGPTSPVYGSVGSGEWLRQRGALFGDDLPAHKARIKLALGLDTSDSPQELQSLFTTH